MRLEVLIPPKGAPMPVDKTIWPGSTQLAPVPAVLVGTGDGRRLPWNLMTAAWALGVGSCWINRARELFDMPEGKALLKKWGLPETLRGVGNCILGYAEGPVPVPKPRKDGYIVRV